MSLILVTGTAGSGKSTILNQLRIRGYVAYGTDEHLIAQWVNRQTGEVCVPPAVFNLHDWYEDHQWTFNLQNIAELRKTADKSNESIYVFGVADGLEAVAHNFSRIVLLAADEATLKRRIAERTDNDFGKAPPELEIILEWQKKHVAEYRKRGGTVIDTSHFPPEEIADMVIALSRSCK